ncbi:ABC transporter permease [Bacillus mangrovi]|uniref:ABC transporter permease n=1 Tax=Metabacillus mangrovi TaxID=1491830 RepID=A0A7X2S0X8_9BACI|nr:ABC transporter permease [Metabacillus mangrovi]MTH51879.1 ABC transporter permease [Metabacillus mangrovi]
MTTNLFAKTFFLAAFIFRLDWLRIIIWLISLGFFTIAVPLAFDGLYATQHERDAMALTMANPAMTAMIGPADLSRYTLGVMTSHQMLLMTAVVTGIMSILLVSRHTRADEEEGRLEMVRSLAAGRLAYLQASFIVMLTVCILLALGTGTGLYALGLQSMDLEGSMLYGAALGATGLFFTGVAAVFAQLSDSSRGTVGLSVAFLLSAYLIRALTDVSNEDLSWISPLSWVTKAEVYDSNRWLPVLLLAAAALLLYAAAIWLNAIRDLGRGLLPSRAGKTHASRFLKSPAGLIFRLQRTGMLSWVAGMFVLGASYGSVLGDLETFLSDNEMMQQLFQPEEGMTVIEQFIPLLLIVISLIAVIPSILSILKLRSEEKKDRLVHLLGRAVSRNELLAGYFTAAVFTGFLMITLGALGLWSAGTAAAEGGISFQMILGAAWAYFPAMLVMVSIAAALIGFIPKWAGAIWFYVVYSFITLYFGELFQFPEWAGKLSPFGYVPHIPVDEFTAMPLILLSAAALLMTSAGFTGFSKRDIEN